MGRLLAIVAGVVIAYIGSGYLEGLFGKDRSQNDKPQETREN